MTVRAGANGFSVRAAESSGGVEPEQKSPNNKSKSDLGLF